MLLEDFRIIGDKRYWGKHYCVVDMTDEEWEEEGLPDHLRGRFCFQRPCRDTPPPPPPPPPKRLVKPPKEGKNMILLWFKTNDNVDDGWLDGDLEVYYNITQATVTVTNPIGNGNIIISGSEFRDGIFDHDAGTWTWYFFGTKYRPSRKRTYVNHKRVWSERQKWTGYIDKLNDIVTIYNDVFHIEFKEDDAWPDLDDDLGSTSFNKNDKSITEPDSVYRIKEGEFKITSG